MGQVTLEGEELCCIRLCCGVKAERIIQNRAGAVTLSDVTYVKELGGRSPRPDEVPPVPLKSVLSLSLGVKGRLVCTVLTPILWTLAGPPSNGELQLGGRSPTLIPTRDARASRMICTNMVSN